MNLNIIYNRHHIVGNKVENGVFHIQNRGNLAVEATFCFISISQLVAEIRRLKVNAECRRL